MYDEKHTEKNQRTSQTNRSQSETDILKKKCTVHFIYDQFSREFATKVFQCMRFHMAEI